MCIKVSANTEHDTLLDAIEAEGIEVPSECRDGYCGTCVCKLKSGQVEYVKDVLAYCDDDSVALCCAKPKTDVIICLTGC